MTKTFETPCHAITIDPPWLIHMFIRGQYTVDQAVAGQRFVAESVKHLPFSVLIVEFGAPTELDMDTRKALADEETRNLRGTAFVNASFELKALSKVVTTGINLTTGIDCPRVFFDTLDEAKVWCQKRHDELVAGG